MSTILDTKGVSVLLGDEYGTLRFDDELLSVASSPSVESIYEKAPENNIPFVSLVYNCFFIPCV